jgi:hypothetical protein
LVDDKIGRVHATNIDRAQRVLSRTVFEVRVCATRSVDGIRANRCATLGLSQAYYFASAAVMFGGRAACLSQN